MLKSVFLFIAVLSSWLLFFNSFLDIATHRGRDQQGDQRGDQQVLVPSVGPFSKVVALRVVALRAWALRDLALGVLV